MNLWLTRPPLAEVLVRGIGGFKMWCVEPVFDSQPRGALDAAVFAHLPIGWTPEPGTLAQAHQCCTSLGDFLCQAGLQGQAQQAWRQMLDQLPRQALTAQGRWSEGFLFGHLDTAWQSYLFELQVPVRWWLIAVERIARAQTDAARSAQAAVAHPLPF